MGTRRIDLGCTFVQWSQRPVHAVFQVEPVLGDIATISGEEWTSDPAIQTRSYRDSYGNRCRRLMLPAGRSEITFRATAEVPDATEEIDLDAPEIAPADLPDEVMIYTLPSRFCLPDVLAGEAWSRFGGVKPGYGRVQAICDYVNQHLTFQYGTTNAWSTAADVHESGYGVCRDFTHLGVSLCRALNIPARYVFGYLPEIEVEHKDAPMDFAAWMQVWLGDRWYTFDPRNNIPRKGRVLIGVGRDAADVAMSTAFGAPWLESMVVVAEESAAS